jgi:release factor glutamine methyltransferase
MPETIQSLINEGAAVLHGVCETSRLDAEILLSHCLQKNRSYLKTWPEKTVDAELSNRYQAFIAQRLQGAPIAYLTGSREFWSRSFKVSPDVLIPRPDSELLIELSLKQIPKNQSCKIIDLGVGSGILAITLALERPDAEIFAGDISEKALNVAKFNASRHNAEHIRFLLSNWFDAVQAREFDFVISNPPYIAKHDQHLQQGDLRFEPDIALVSEENGLKDIRLIAEQSRGRLKKAGQLFIEHGYNQQLEVQTILKKLNYCQVTTHTDLSGNPRVTSGILNHS